MATHEHLFSVTLYRDGTVRISGHPKQGTIADILRIIADAIDAGDLPLSEETDWHL